MNVIHYIFFYYSFLCERARNEHTIILRTNLPAHSYVESVECVNYFLINIYYNIYDAVVVFLCAAQSTKYTKSYLVAHTVSYHCSPPPYYNNPTPPPQQTPYASAQTFPCKYTFFWTSVLAQKKKTLSIICEWVKKLRHFYFSFIYIYIFHCILSYVIVILVKLRIFVRVMVTDSSTLLCCIIGIWMIWLIFTETLKRSLRKKKTVYKRLRNDTEYEEKRKYRTYIYTKLIKIFLVLILMSQVMDWNKTRY